MRIAIWELDLVPTSLKTLAENCNHMTPTSFLDLIPSFNHQPRTLVIFYVRYQTLLLKDTSITTFMWFVSFSLPLKVLSVRNWRWNLQYFIFIVFFGVAFWGRGVVVVLYKLDDQYNYLLSSWPPDYKLYSIIKNTYSYLVQLQIGSCKNQSINNSHRLICQAQIKSPLKAKPVKTFAQPLSSSLF